MLNKDYLVDVIRKQFYNIKYENIDFYNDYEIIVSKDEQMIFENQKAIYIVIRFEEGTMFNDAQQILPFTISAFCDINAIEISESLLTSFAEKHHLRFDESGKVKQYYNTPYITSNFNDVFDGFKHLFNIDGTFLIGERTNRVKITDRESKKVIDTLESSFDYTAQLDSQVTYASNNFSNSVGRTGTRVLSFSANSTNDDYIVKALKVANEDLTLSNGINTDFEFDLEFDCGVKLSGKKWKLSGLSFVQSISNFPVIALIFTN